MGQLFNLIIISTLLINIHNLTQAAVYDITNFNAKPDGKSDSSQSFLKAWSAACTSSSPSTIRVPAGIFLVNQVKFMGPCKSSKISFQIDGTITSPSNYDKFVNKGEWIHFEHVDGVSMYGGVIDGSGTSLWSCKANALNCPAGATSLTFTKSRNIMISGLTSINSKLYHIVIDRCEEVTVQNVKISAPGNSPNTDGIHVEMSSNVQVSGAQIKTGDDCISVGSGTTNLWIEQVSCGPGHGISIGSLGKYSQENGVQNVTVKSTVFTGSQNGLRIKTWGRPSTAFVKNVLFEQAMMQNVENPVIIDQNYCPDNRGCPDQNSGVKISGVSYKDIKGSSATRVAVKFDCSSSNPCTDIKLQDIKLTYRNKVADSSCTNARGSASSIVQPPSCF